MTKRILFVVVAVLLAAAGLYFRGQNAASAQTQANHIVAQDKAGADTAADLAALKTFVKTHIGASVGFSLAGSYSRAQAAAQAAAAATAANSQIYAAAQAVCAGKSDSITQAKCNENYLSQHLVNVPAPSPVATPRSIDYQYDLGSPFWTPDLAGALFLGAVLALVAAAYSYARRLS